LVPEVLKMRVVCFACLLSALALCSVAVIAQVEDLRESTGLPFSVDSRLVYGRVVLNGLDPSEKPPTVNVTLYDRQMVTYRTSANQQGYYYFRDLQREGGTIVVEVNGVEVARQTLPPFGPKQQRQDFIVLAGPRRSAAKPGTVSAKYAYERPKDNAALLDKAVAAVEKGDGERSIGYLNKLLAKDPKDYVAWTLLGSIQFGSARLAEAESAYLNAIKAKSDLAYAMINLGMLYLDQKRYDAAIEILERATAAEPTSAPAFKHLGEAYLYAKMGSKAVPALNEAIRLAPEEMASCHLMLARLYQIAGDIERAAKEYKALLAKVPDHPEREKIEKFIAANPE
jgi:tetratricopeptide (TPR) repeat protein